MTPIRATCSECGDVTLQPVDVEILLRRSSSEGHMEFRCPRCDKQNRRAISSRIIVLLKAVGCHHTVAKYASRSRVSVIHAKCPGCGYDNDLKTANIKVGVNFDRYHYDCAHCGKTVENEANKVVLNLLLDAGCQVNRAA